MSQHKTPLTELERAGLEAHHLPIGTPSRLSDSFRNGMKWALANQKTYEETVAQLAETMYHRYMGGSNEYSRVDGLEIVCFIYGVDRFICHNDITGRFHKAVAK